jgi:transposase
MGEPAREKDAPTVDLPRPYSFRLYPTPAQTEQLLAWERQLRWLYNLAHEQRLHALQRGRSTLERAPGHCPSCGARTDFTKEQRKRGLKPEHTSACTWVDYYRQAKEMTEIIRGDARLGSVVCCARQEVLRDLEKAWQRWRKGLGGRPRFKRRTDSVRIYFSTPKDWGLEHSKLSFRGKASSFGEIQVNRDRPWPGDPLPNGLTKARKAKLAKRPVPTNVQFSSCHIVRDGSEWYAVFSLRATFEVVRPPKAAVGINRGMVHAIADSDGRVIESPRYYQRALKQIRKRARDVSRKTPQAMAARLRRGTRLRGQATSDVERLMAELSISKGNAVYQLRKRGSVEAAIAHVKGLPPPAPKSPPRPQPETGCSRKRAVHRLQVAHQKVRRQREWFLHEQSAYYAKTYALIGIEDWSTRKMTTSERKPKGLAPEKRNKQILDVGWYEFARQLTYKSAAHGGHVVKVDPVDLSRIDSETGVVRATPASGHAMWTTERGEKILGDVNAARNVLGRAIAMPPPVPKAPRASIQIKGRAKAQTETPAKPAGEASGGDAPARAPVEAGTPVREDGHPERTVLPTKRRRRGLPNDARHQAMEKPD